MVRPNLACTAAVLACLACTAAVTTGEYMRGHFRHQQLLVDAAAHQDPEGVRRAARELADLSDDQDLPGWSDPYLDTFRRRSVALSRSPDPLGEGPGVGTLLRSCGACHEADPDGPPNLGDDGPPPGQDPSSHMVRHAWALERMATGLVGPSEALWTRGLQALIEPPLDAGDLVVAPAHQAEAGRLADRFHRDAGRARRLQEWDDRADALDGLVARCAECHGLRGVGADGLGGGGGSHGP